MTLRTRRRISLAGTDFSSRNGSRDDDTGSLSRLKDELVAQRVKTEIAWEISKQAAARTETLAQKRTPWIRRTLTGLGIVIASLGVGDSLRPDSPELIAHANRVELAIFHNEGDAEKLMVFGSSLIGGSQIKRRKKKRTGPENV